MPAKGQYKRGAKADSVRQRKWNSSSVQKKRRAIRNKHRLKAIKLGRVRKGSTKEIDHGDRRNLTWGSTSVMSRRKNRAKNSPLRRIKRHR